MSAPGKPQQPCPGLRHAAPRLAREQHDSGMGAVARLRAPLVGGQQLTVQQGALPFPHRVLTQHAQEVLFQPAHVEVGQRAAVHRHLLDRGQAAGLKQPRRLLAPARCTVSPRRR